MHIHTFQIQWTCLAITYIYIYIYYTLCPDKKWTHRTSVIASLGAVGSKYLILLEIYSGVTVPKIMEIGWHSTNLMQKAKKCSFLRHRVRYIFRPPFFKIQLSHAYVATGHSRVMTLICVLVAKPRRCLTLSNPVPWQNWMGAYLGYTLRMTTLFRGWPVMAHDTHTRRRRQQSPQPLFLQIYCDFPKCLYIHTLYKFLAKALGTAPLHTTVAVLREAVVPFDTRGLERHPFLPRNAMRSTNYAVKKCLSVRPSVRHTPVFCRNGNG